MTRNARLLIVDDNAATRYALRRVLERRGYSVEEAGTGTDGLALIAAHAFDALLLDVNLPDMSGFDIVRQLRADPVTALLPVVHVSAASIQRTDVVTGLDAGADAYLIHPIDPEVLAATLSTLLRVRDSERALRESEARFREIFSHIAAPIAVIDASLRLHESNHAFARLLDCGDGEAQLVDCLADGQEAVLGQLRERLAANERWRGTLTMRVGSLLRETEWRVAPYRAPDVGVIFVEDVTEQRRRERTQQAKLETVSTELARTEAQLLQVQKMDALGNLTGGIAHDFNNLLTGIIAGIELMSKRIEQGRPEDVQRFADAALGSARRAAALTHRLLAFARQQPLDAQPVDVNERIGSLDDLLHRTIGEKVALRFFFTASPAVARVDANQLDNAILNLVINARDALPDGGYIHVVTAMQHLPGDSDLAGGEYVSVSVRDNGTGIAPELIEKVFEPFFTTKPLGQGTGLGLSMIYGFARQSGGHVRIVSTPGEGTEVTMLLPAAEPYTGAVAVAAPHGARGRDEFILLVEDTDSVRMVASEVLNDAGYRCMAVADIETALLHLRGDADIDLLLTDVGLPVMNGRQLAEAARAWRPHLPVLFMTGYAENAIERDEFLGTRMDMIIKPFEVEALLTKVRAMLDD